MSLLGQPDHELLMLGIFVEIYRIGNIVKKVYRKYPNDDGSTEESIKATHNEASIYRLLGSHPGIAECLYIDPAMTYVELKFYPDENLKRFSEAYSTHIEDSHRKRWARQMIEGVEYIHTMGVKHSDLRLEQWLLDDRLDARLSDFNASGYDSNVNLGLKGSEAMGAEDASHFLPRDVALDNTIESDLFALGSTLFELMTGKAPYDHLPRESIEDFFKEGVFPYVDGLFLS